MDAIAYGQGPSGSGFCGFGAYVCGVASTEAKPKTLPDGDKARGLSVRTGDQETWQLSVDILVLRFIQASAPTSFMLASGGIHYT